MNQICSCGIPSISTVTGRMGLARWGGWGSGPTSAPQRARWTCPRLSSSCLNKRQNGWEAEGGREVKE